VKLNKFVNKFFLFIEKEKEEKMVKKFVWIILSCLITAALVLSSCSTPVAEEEEGQTIIGEVTEQEGTEVEEGEEAGEEGDEMVLDAFGNLVEKPQYGGIITYAYDKDAVLIDMDPARAAYAHEMTAHVYESPFAIDWSKGPQGSGETDFQSPYFLPTYYTGALAESWEIVDYQTVVFQVRQGVYFHNKPPVNGREMTADDIIASFNLYLESPNHSSWFRPEGVAAEDWHRMEKTGTWEITYTSPTPNPEIIKNLADVQVMAKEMVEGYNTRNEVSLSIGTGPFILTDVVTASSATFLRNDNYWQTDYRHPDNKLPYADGIRAVVIEDISTNMAALRTYKIDLNLYVAPRDGKNLIETNPEMQYNTIVPLMIALVHMRTDLADEPYSDVRVRQAMQMALNYEEMAATIYEGSPYTMLYPIAPGMPGYTPYEELPANLQELWSYNPEKAKELLTEAGYPDGFDGVFNMSPYWEDMVIAMSQYWSEIGIDMELRVVDDAASFAAVTGDYEDLITWFIGTSYMNRALSYVNGGMPGNWMNISRVDDPLAVEFTEKFESTLDSAERVELLKAENLRQMELVWEIPSPALVNYRMWAPWIKGYVGENNDRPEKYMWVDQDLRYDITNR